MLTSCRMLFRYEPKRFAVSSWLFPHCRKSLLWLLLQQHHLEGLTITCKDYKEVFERYKDVPDVVFLVDPPYLSTEVGTYNMMYWRLADYLDVLNVLKGHSFVYFTSNKSSILELCGWMDRNPFIGNPFMDCRKIEFNAQMNYNSKYTDIMLYTTPKERQSMIS